MDRFVLTDAHWAKMEPLCLGKKTNRGRSGKDNRLFIEAVLWIARTGSPWRDLPTYFRHWNSVYSRYSDWTKAGVFQKIFEAVSEDADMEYAMIDGIVVGFIAMAWAQKGDHKTGNRAQCNGMVNQDNRHDRRLGQSGPLHPDP